MSARFGWTCLAALAILGGTVATTEAQVIVITDVQYKAAAGGNPATAEPKGTWSLPGDGNTYRVFVDYGYIDKGVFKADANVSKGGPGTMITTKVGGGGNYNWSVNGPHTLTNPMAGLYARARIQKQNGMNWDDVAGAVAYAPIPIPGGGRRNLLRRHNPRNASEPIPRQEEVA